MRARAPTRTRAPMTTKGAMAAPGTDGGGRVDDGGGVDARGDLGGALEDAADAGEDVARTRGADGGGEAEGLPVGVGPEDRGAGAAAGEIRGEALVHGEGDVVGTGGGGLGGAGHGQGRVAERLGVEGAGEVCYGDHGDASAFGRATYSGSVTSPSIHPMSSGARS